MNDFFEKLDKYLKKKGLNDNKLTIKSGMSNGIIGKARKRGALSQENIAKILHFCSDLNANWLFGVSDTMLKESEKPIENSVATCKTRTAEINEQQIPVYDITSVSNISFLFEKNENTTPIGHISVFNLPKCDGAIHIVGEEMYPFLRSGDVVMYRQVANRTNYIYWGQLYLVSIAVDKDEYLMVKYIQKSDKGEDYVKLVSQNKQYQDKEVAFSDIKGLALIKASIRINTAR